MCIRDRLKAALAKAAGEAAEKIGAAEVSADVSREISPEGSPVNDAAPLAESNSSESNSSGGELAVAPFRLPIDRTFTMAGHGTVVTGSVVSGRASLGDELTIQPGNVPVRIRGIHNHDTAVDSVSRGQRAAINVAGIHHEEIHRGHELTAVGHLLESRLITTKIHLLKSATRPLKNLSLIHI